MIWQGSISDVRGLIFRRLDPREKISEFGLGDKIFRIGLLGSNPRDQILEILCQICLIFLRCDIAYDTSSDMTSEVIACRSSDNRSDIGSYLWSEIESDIGSETRYGISLDIISCTGSDIEYNIRSAAFCHSHNQLFPHTIRPNIRSNGKPKIQFVIRLIFDPISALWHPRN